MRIVIVGGGPAGMAAASRVRKHTPDSEVIVIERTRYVSFALCGIPYYIGGIIKSLDDLLYYPPEFFVKKRGINLELDATAKEIDINEKKVIYEKRGEIRELEYNRLIVATGARPKFPPISGLSEEGILTAHHLDEGEEIRRRVQKAKSVAVIGAGLNGMEFSENIARLGKEVHVFEAMGWPLPMALDEDMGSILKKRIGEPVKFHFNSPVFEVRKVGEKFRILYRDSAIDVDLVLVFTGIEPSVDLLKNAGAEIGDTGAIKVNSKMETSIKDIYAAGDIAETINRVTGKPDWMPFAQIANKMGLVAGSNAAGKDVEFPGAVKTWTVELFGVEVAGTGLTEGQARKIGYDVRGEVIRGRTKAHYMPDTKDIWIKILVDQDGRVLGVQAIGKGALSKVNVAAALLPYRVRSEDIIFADMGYAPPLSPVWDPLIVAGRKMNPIL